MLQPLGIHERENEQIYYDHNIQGLSHQMPGIIFLCKIIQISKVIMLGLGKIKDLGINKMLSKKQKVKRFFTKILQQYFSK